MRTQWVSQGVEKEEKEEEQNPKQPLENSVLNRFSLSRYNFKAFLSPGQWNVSVIDMFYCIDNINIIYKTKLANTEFICNRIRESYFKKKDSMALEKHTIIPNKTETSRKRKFSQFLCEFVLKGFTTDYRTWRKILDLPPPRKNILTTTLYAYTLQFISIPCSFIA